MIKGFPVEFVRVALEQTLLKNKISNHNLVGGKNEIEIHSFYEQLKTQDEVDRFVETFRDLTEQQNRMGLIANGILMSPDNPTITNLYTSMIIPMTWACSLRVKLSDRDVMLETINELIEELKGSKVDIAELKCRDEQGRAIYIPFAVGTLGHNENAPTIRGGDYIGDFVSATPTDSDIKTRLAAITAFGLTNSLADNDYVYLGAAGTIKVAQKGLNQPIETENWSVGVPTGEDIGHNKAKVSGTVTFSSVNGGYTEVPETSLPTIKCYLAYGDDGYDEHEVEITNITTTLDESGHILFSGEYSFIVFGINEYIDDIDVVFDSVISEPSTLGYAIISSSDESVIFLPEHESFDKYKLSLSFEGLRCDTPRTLNGDEYCEISFGGSATLVNNGVKLGNDLVKLSVSKNKILAQSPITFTSAPIYWLEPLELPSGNSANTIPNQLVSNAFKVNTHTDSMTLTLQYTFIIDENQTFLSQLYKYGRYGTQGITVNDISPNIIYNVAEYWSSWGEIDKETYQGKLIESVDIENTESDTMTITATFQIQGANN